MPIIIRKLLNGTQLPGGEWSERGFLVGVHFFERIGSGDTTSCALIGCDGGSGEAIEWTGEESTNDIKVSGRFSH